MASTQVLVLGLDPRTVAGYDPEPVVAKIEEGRRRFAELGLTEHHELLPYDADDAEQERRVVEALRREPYACVVIGGGLRTDEPRLAFFERVVNLVRRHAPQAAIAFNAGAADAADAARRWVCAPPGDAPSVWC
ncbi:hypothetical protein ACFPK1_07530 [Actinomycetospora rhizophila]|uniref:Uncharacterized protein n=1 Tax=Actinomycetospora rhizophila TaxID=1416876 RepID=A0ABV9Z900_9PSEU